MAENSEDIAEILYSFVSATPSGTAGEKTLFNQNGDRRLVKLGTDIKYDNGTNVDKAVLTLLNKESKLYSLSIKVDKSKVVNLNSLKFKERRLYSSKTETYININLNQNINLSHVLFIGEVKQLGGNFKINKTILITKDVGKGQEQKYDDITDEEEYLNLHHIDYFSFIYDDFIKMYDEYKDKNKSQQNPESGTKFRDTTAKVINTSRISQLPKKQPAPAPEGAGAAPKADEAGAEPKADEAARKKAQEAQEAQKPGAQEGQKKEPREEDEDDEEEEEEDEATAATRATAARDQDVAEGTGDEAGAVELVVVPVVEEEGNDEARAAAQGAQVVEQVEPGPGAPTQKQQREGTPGGGKKKVKKTKTKKSQKSLNN